MNTAMVIMIILSFTALAMIVVCLCSISFSMKTMNKQYKNHTNKLFIVFCETRNSIHSLYGYLLDIQKSIERFNEYTSGHLLELNERIGEKNVFNDCKGKDGKE